MSTSPQFDSDSTSMVADLRLSQSSFDPGKDSIFYWWKVKAQDGWGESRWSNEVFRFDVENYGDINGDGKVNAGDVVYLINYLYRGGAAPQPLAEGDINGDCQVNAGDLIYLVNYLYRGGEEPVRGCA